jgi:hypothetical protein
MLRMAAHLLADELDRVHEWIAGRFALARAAGYGSTRLD